MRAVSFVLVQRCKNIECSAFALFSGCGNESVMVLNNFFTDGQTNTSTRIFIFIMKALKKFKYLLFILLVETNAIITDAQNMVVFFGYGPLIYV